ncbi:5-formyltetrahydrofolate cyclo-ligase family protein [Mannheimia haemolytica]|uniref:5-formyltetrahydrofolate cyclo-ligase family protein n=1 Tax=Mannheimia haemolytica TaxID=75985 RepID=A0A378MRR0_MANHA|nr:5-formyltetrahydrofolate cyclo-ligase family protein [Mannheimia haemolytica]
MNQSSLTDLRSQLRQSMRLKRQSLTAGQQTQAAESIIPQALSLIESYQASHIAFYLPFNGEISPIPLMEQLLQQGKKAVSAAVAPFYKRSIIVCKLQLQNYSKI